jgi:malonyl CoA-acyl carrier protein transacylase
MAGDILGHFAVADRLVETASDWLGYDVAAVCLEGSTRKALPLRTEVQVLYVVDCAYAEVLRQEGLHPEWVCGHSMGTYAAAYTAGVFNFLTGLRLASTVEDLLEQLIEPRSQAMGVVLGLPLERLGTIVSRGEVYLANFNSPGQFVLAGARSDVERALAAAEAAGASKTKWLGNAWAFHTPLLGRVCRRVERVLERMPLRAPSVPLVGSSDGLPLRTTQAVRRHLVRFLCEPVRWETTVRRLASAAADPEFLEVGPGTVLTDLMGYIDRTVPVQTASDLLREVVAT